MNLPPFLSTRRFFGLRKVLELEFKIRESRLSTDVDIKLQEPVQLDSPSFSMRFDKD